MFFNTSLLYLYVDIKMMCVTLYSRSCKQVLGVRVFSPLRVYAGGKCCRYCRLVEFLGAKFNDVKCKNWQVPNLRFWSIISMGIDASRNRYTVKKSIKVINKLLINLIHGSYLQITKYLSNLWWYYRSFEWIHLLHIIIFIWKTWISNTS